jgi:hypothetical protein
MLLTMFADNHASHLLQSMIRHFNLASAALLKQLSINIWEFVSPAQAIAALAASILYQTKHLASHARTVGFWTSNSNSANQAAQLINNSISHQTSAVYALLALQLIQLLKYAKHALTTAPHVPIMSQLSRCSA